MSLFKKKVKNLHIETDISSFIHTPTENEICEEEGHAVAIRIGTHMEEKFIENNSEFIDKQEYSRNGKDPGMLVIFNQETFISGLKDRSGTQKDVDSLIITLGRMKFNVDEKFIFTDFTNEQINAKIAEICKMDLTQINSLICVFLSHGGYDNKLSTKDGNVTAEDIYKPFAKCETLVGKPKLFLFQACKKSGPLNTLDTVDSEKIPKLVSDRTLEANIPEDLLLVYATLEGEYSFRHNINGTWFIQELCRNITAYGRRDDVASLIMRTTKCVAYNYFYETDDSFVKQMPIFISTLTKKFYLVKSKERDFLLRIIEENKKLKEIINKISQKVDNIYANTKK